MRKGGATMNAELQSKRKEVIAAGALGNCVHVAGIAGFLRIADELGHETHFLGSAVSVDDIVDAVDRYSPSILGVSYRLTSAAAENLFIELKQKLGKERIKGLNLVFGGTPPVCRMAESSGLFDRCFDGFENLTEIRKYLGGNLHLVNRKKQSGDLITRIKDASPIPLQRHHFGLPDLEETVEGIKRIAESEVLDIISLAPDQNAQESFFRPQDMDSRLDGAGGVPVRTEEDLLRIREAASAGNHPLLRIYSGTRDLILWAELSAKTIGNAWGAVPLYWYNSLDRRSKRPLKDAIKENQSAMRWYGKAKRCLEVNESHHWSLRDAHDTVAVAASYLAAYNAKAAGVTHYIAQYMFNTPPTVSPSMDLAKMLAKIEMTEALHDETFTTYRQVRAGLLHLSPDPHIAKGQLAASTMLSLQIKPHIIHVVGYCEGDHAALPEEVMESCRIVQGVVKNCLFGLPDHASDKAVQNRKQQLIKEAKLLLQAVQALGKGSEDPFTNPDTLARAVKIGLLDAPHLRGNPYAAGNIETRAVKGGIFAWDRDANKIIPEKDRIDKIMKTSEIKEISWAE